MNSSQASSAVQGSSPVLIDALNYSSWTVLLMGFSYGVLLATSGFIVRGTLSYADVELSDNDERDTGTAIGKLENVLVLTLMLLEAYTALGVIFAAKSIIRKSDIDTGDTTYYLTGTLSNFTYSVLIGVLLHVGLWIIIRSNLF